MQEYGQGCFNVILHLLLLCIDCWRSISIPRQTNAANSIVDQPHSGGDDLYAADTQHPPVSLVVDVANTAIYRTVV